jgi:hypothetical protein
VNVQLPWNARTEIKIEKNPKRRRRKENEDES